MTAAVVADLATPAALRILLVGVNAADAGRVRQALAAAGYAPTWWELPSLEAVTPDALSATAWQAVIVAASVEPAASTHLAELQAALADQRRAMQALSVRLSEVEENARRRLSAELHDRVGQSLVVLGLTLSVVRGQLAAAGAEQLAGQVVEALRVTDEMATQVRDVMVELRPPVLDDFGLLAALQAHAARFTATTGLPVTVVGAETSPRLPLIVETALFRVTQEALTNVLRHAQARAVTLTLTLQSDYAQLTIADDGRGFSPQRPRSLGERPRWGLLTMRERVETVGGTMRVVSAPGAGTRIILEVAR